MGVWGVGALENDEAADWAIGFDDADLAGGFRFLGDALVAAAAQPTFVLTRCMRFRQCCPIVNATRSAAARAGTG
jgi:hypothetical protein